MIDQEWANLVREMQEIKSDLFSTSWSIRLFKKKISGMSEASVLAYLTFLQDRGPFLGRRFERFIIDIKDHVNSRNDEILAIDPSMIKNPSAFVKTFQKMVDAKILDVSKKRLVKFLQKNYVPSLSEETIRDLLYREEDRSKSAEK